MISNALSPHVQSRPSLLLVPSAMALKAVLILAALGLVYSENSHCSAFGGTNGNDGRDCTCGDKAFSDCLEPVTDDQIHTANLEECKFQCDLFASFGACDWFIYVTAGMDENCHLFGPVPTVATVDNHACAQDNGVGHVHRGLQHGLQVPQPLGLFNALEKGLHGVRFLFACFDQLGKRLSHHMDVLNPLELRNWFDCLSRFVVCGNGLGAGTTKDDKVKERVGAEPVVPVHGRAAHLSSSIEAGHDLVIAICIKCKSFAAVVGGDATHVVVDSGNDRDGLPGDIYTSKDHRSLGDTWQPGHQLLRGQMVQLQEDVILFWATAPALADFHGH